MFELKLYRSSRLPKREDLDVSPLGATFRGYLSQGWLRSAAGSDLLYRLARGIWDDRDGDFWHGPEGLQPAVHLPGRVKFALVLAENSRRGLWTAMPQELAGDPGAMEAVWDALARQTQDFRLALRFYEDQDLGLLEYLRKNELPLRVRMGGQRREGPVSEVFRGLFHLPSPMTLLRAVRALRRQLPPGWKEETAPFVPRRAGELGYGDWTFRNCLAAEPYRMDGTPLLHSHVPVCLTVTRHAGGDWTLDFPAPDTLFSPDLPDSVNGYDELMALCGQGLAPGDRRWALVCDREFSPRIPLASPCFGFAYDEPSRVLYLTEEDDALQMMQDALTHMLRETNPREGGAAL